MVAVVVVVVGNDVAVFEVLSTPGGRVVVVSISGFIVCTGTCTLVVLASSGASDLVVTLYVFGAVVDQCVFAVVVEAVVVLAVPATE